MTVFVNRSIPLSQESRDGWRNAGAVVLARNDGRAIRRLADVSREDVVLNLGIGTMHLVDCNIWNVPDTVRSILTPAAIRRTMPDLIPPQDFEGPHWLKGPGQHGVNKQFHDHGEGWEVNRCDWELDQRPQWAGQWDIQKHIEGTEFRVITVGNSVVQAHRKQRSTLPGLEIDFGFEWSWVGVGGIKNNGLIPLVKKAVALIPNGDRSVVGWDCIVGEAGAYIIEGNTSPGVNDATARRIVEAIQRLV